MGKSRLVEEIVRLAVGAGTVVLSGRSVPDAGPLRPFAEALIGSLRQTSIADHADLHPFRPALTRLLPGWAGPDADLSVDPHVVLGEGIAQLLRLVAGANSALVVLEDLHWADAETLAVLDYLADSLSGSRVAVLAAARADEVGARRLAGLRRSVLTEIVLPRLVPSDVRTLARACTQATALPAEVETFLIDTAEGLPFLVEELLAGLVESGALQPGPHGWTVSATLTATVPRTLTDVVRARLELLSPDACSG